MNASSDLSTRREAFIPYLRRDLVEMCVADGGLPKGEQEAFRELCEILCAYLHFQFLRDAEAVKEHYGPLDPDRETVPRGNSAESPAASEQRLVEIFRSLAQRANYFEIRREHILECFRAVTLIDLKTAVDLEDFERVLCFARGDLFKTATVKRLWKRKEVRVDVLQRVLLLLKFKDERYFQAAKKKQRRAFQPGKIYVYLYKDVPKYDLELLFPNVQVGMNLKDLLLFGVPAIGGSVAVLVKAAPQILIITGVILFFLAGPAWAMKVGVTEDAITSFMPVITALLGLVIALGGLAFKQWNNYRNKRLAFLKDVSEQLFFRNLATNRSVFHRLIDSAEEEEGKEMILVLYHLLAHSGEGISREVLDATIEAWMRDNFDATIDFDIGGPLGNLARLRGADREGREVSLVETDSRGRLRVLPITDAKCLLDGLWDSAFHYTGSVSTTGTG